MSRKIYNEIVLQWNEVTNQYDTLYEDSYDYDGPLMLAIDDELGGLDFEEISRGWTDVSKSFTSTLKSQTKKASALGASQFKKAFVGVASNVNMLLQKAVANKTIGETLGANIGNAMESALAGTADPKHLRTFGAELIGIANKSGEINDKMAQWGESQGMDGGQKAFDLTLQHAKLIDEDNIAGAQNLITDIATKMGVSQEAAEMMLKQWKDMGSENLLQKTADWDPNVVIDPLSAGFQKMTANFGKDMTMAAENMELQALEKQLEDSVKGGVTTALDVIPDNAFTQALGLDKFKEQMGEAVSESVVGDALVTKMQGFGKKLGGIAKNHWGKVMGAAMAVGLGIMLISKLAEQTDQIGNSFGAIGVNEFQTDLMSANTAAIGLGYGFEEVESSVSALTAELGIGIGEAAEMSATTMDTARALGMGTDEAAKLTAELMNVSGHSAETASNFLKQTAALAASAGVAPGAVLADMSESSEEIASFAKGGGENMAKAAVKARQMGMSLGDAATMANSLLDFSSSLEAELTASVMIGRELNLQKMRELALAGDLAGMQDEALKQVGSEAEFNEMNVLQRQALADAMGVEVSQLAKMVATAGKSNAELMKMGELDISDVVSEDAVSGITLLTNQMKMFGQFVLTGVGYLASLTSGLGPIAGPILTALVLGLGAVGIYMGFIYLKTMMQAKANLAVAGSIDVITAAETRRAAAAVTSDIVGGADDMIPDIPDIPGGGGGFMDAMPSAKSMLQGAAAILVLAAALWVSAKAFQEFGSVEWSAVATGVIGISLLAGVAMVLGKLKGPILSGAFAIGILSLALVPMAHSFNMIKDVGFGTMIGFAAALTVFAIAAALLGNIAVPIMVGAAALLVLGLALIPTTYAFSLLTGVDMGMLLQLSGVLLVLGASFGLLGAMTPFIIAGAVGMGILSAALIPMTYAFSLLTGVDIGMLTGLSSVLLGLGASFGLLGAMTPLIILGSYGMLLLSAALIPMTYAFSLLQGVDLGMLTGLSSVLLGLGASFGLLGAMTPAIVLGSFGMLLLSAALIPMTYAFSLLQGVDLGMLAGLSSVLLGLGASFGLLGIMTPAIVLGSYGMLLLSAALIPMTYAFSLLQGVDLGMLTGLSSVLLGLGASFGLLGTMTPFIILGAVGMGILSAALIPMTYAFSLLQGVDINMLAGLSSVLLGLGVSFGALGAMTPFIILGSFGMNILSAALIPMTYALSLLQGVDVGMLTGLGSTLVDLGSKMALLGIMTPLILLGSYALMIMSSSFGIFGSAMILMGTGLQMTMPFLTEISSIMGQLIPQVAGIHLLASSLTNLAAGLFMVGAAGLFAAPALTLLGATGLLGGGIGKAATEGGGEGEEGQSETALLKAELVEIKNHLQTLTVGFGKGPAEGGYLTGIGQETAKGIKNSKITAVINKGLI